MSSRKICFIADSRFSYHNPGLDSFYYLKKYYKNGIFLEYIPNNINDFLMHNKVDIVIFFIVPTISPTIYELKLISKKYLVGIYFDDTAQYFSNWFKYLTQVIDFAICWEPSDVSLFESYGVSAGIIHLLAVTYVNEFELLKIKPFNDREINFLHIGRMDRPGRNSVMDLIQKEVDKSEFWGDGTQNGYISRQDYVLKINNAKISFNNSACAQYEFIRKSDSIELSRRQLKGKIFHYLLGGSLLITEDSPMLNDYFSHAKDLIIIDKNDNLMSLVKHYLTPNSQAANIAFEGRSRAMNYLKFDENIEKLNNLIATSELNKLRNNKSDVIYLDKYYVRSIVAFDGFLLLENFTLLLKFMFIYRHFIHDLKIHYFLFRKFFKILLLKFKN